jgi:hypothetical protein
MSYHAELKGGAVGLDWEGAEGPIGAFFTLIYNLWKARNGALASQRIQDPAAVVGRTLVGVEE